MPGNGYRRRVARLERSHRCPVHPEEWLVCADDLLDFTRLTAEEHAALEALLERLFPLLDTEGVGPGYNPCVRCGKPRDCLTCSGHMGSSLREAYSDEEFARLTDLMEKVMQSKGHAR